MSTADEITAFEKSVQERGLRVADILREAGVDRSMWTRWKNGKTVPRLDNWRSIERAVESLSGAQV